MGVSLNHPILLEAEPRGLVLCWKDGLDESGSVAWIVSGRLTLIVQIASVVYQRPIHGSDVRQKCARTAIDTGENI